MAEEKSNCIPPKVYAIWADAKPDGPMNGQSGFLSEGEHRLFFASQEDADLKICDLKNLCLNRISATEYQSVEYPGGHDPMASVRAEDVKAYDLRLGPEPIRYEITQRIYGNTGGGCMVGTLALRLPELDKTVWVNCNDEGVTITSADCIWNEDHSDSWNRYEDVVMFEIDFREDAPESIWPLLPAIQEAIAYTIGQETDYSGTPFRIPARWLPESYRQQADPQFLKWALEQNKDIRIGKGGILHPDKEFIRNNLGQLVYIASPLSGDVEQNLHFARQACRYAISKKFRHRNFLATAWPSHVWSISCGESQRL